MPANWSTCACTVEASRVRMRSTAELARLLAMADALGRELLGQVGPERLHRDRPGDRRQRNQDEQQEQDDLGEEAESPRPSGPALGIARPRGRRLHRRITCDRGGGRRRAPLLPLDPLPLRHRCHCRSSSLCLHGGGPVRDGDPAAVLDAGEVDAVQPLMTLGAEGERGADARGRRSAATRAPAGGRRAWEPGRHGAALPRSPWRSRSPRG